MTLILFLLWLGAFFGWSYHFALVLNHVDIDKYDLYFFEIEPIWFYNILQWIIIILMFIII